MDVIAALSTNLARQGRAIDYQLVRAAAQAALEPFGLTSASQGNMLRGSSLSAIAEKFSIAVGGGRGGARESSAVAMAGFTDFPVFIDEVVRTSVLAGWESAKGSFDRFVRPVSVTDFRPTARVSLGGLSNLAELAEGDEVPSAQFGGFIRSISARRHGIILRLTEEMVVNNNLGPLIENAIAAGRAAAGTISGAIYSLLASNPFMADGGQLFNATSSSTAGGHANLAFTATALSSTSLSIGKAAMRRQTAVAGGRPMNIRPRFLIVSAENEENAWAVAGVQGGFGEAGSEQERYNLNCGRVEIISAPELAGPAWYLAADPIVAPVIEIAYLDGRPEPRVELAGEFGNDRLEMKVTFDFGAAAADWRGGFKNDGE